MMTVTAMCSSPSPFPPKTTKPLIPIPMSIPTHYIPIPTPLPRRHAVALLVSLIPQPLPAFAINLGISGPKDWLREQKKKSIKYLLAPIDASRDILRYAYQLLVAMDSKYEEKDIEEIQGLLRSAARDCVPEERNSFVTFQSKTGVEVCTFKLVVKNASSLLDDKDPTKAEAEARLTNLIRSFISVNGVAKEANFQLISDREKIADALMDVLSYLGKFEQSIKGCIDA